jgi:hypothetical protein
MTDASVSVMAEKPALNIPEQEVEFENLGTTIEVIVNGTTTVAGSEFQLVQFHMHTPSEHHINGEYHPLEVHMVHQGVGKSNSILYKIQRQSYLTQYSRPDPDRRRSPHVPSLSRRVLINHQVARILRVGHHHPRNQGRHPRRHRLHRRARQGRLLRRSPILRLPDHPPLRRGRDLHDCQGPA